MASDNGTAMTRSLDLYARRLALALATSLPGAAFAHPHIFIDTGLEVIFDAEGEATGVRVTWDYDDFYSMLTIEDRALDPDGDGKLTPEEIATLKGFDMAWDADYDGDLYALEGSARIAMGRPTEATASYLDGRITSTHLRAFASPVKVGTVPLILQAYDPTYYTAYEISGTVTLTGAPAGCKAQVFEADKAAADRELQAAFDELQGSDTESQFPAVGAAYADELRVTCAPG